MYNQVYGKIGNRPGHGKAPTECGSSPSAAASAGGRPSGHDRHALAKAAVSRYKRVIGDAPRSRTDRRATEVVVQALNRMPGFGRPESARVAWTRRESGSMRPRR